MSTTTPSYVKLKPPQSVPLGSSSIHLFCMFVASLVLNLQLAKLASSQPYVSTSPDGAHRVVVTKKTGFGLADPPVDLWVNLESTATGAVIDQVIIGIDEDSDVGQLSAQWRADTVVIDNLEQAHHVSATLQRSGRK
jgi:hypothetical protein